MSDPEERDMAHEADMEKLRREQLEADCGGEMADDLDDPDDWDYDEDDRDDGLQFCNCSINHSMEEVDWNQCDCCGKAIE